MAPRRIETVAADGSETHCAILSTHARVSEGSGTAKRLIAPWAAPPREPTRSSTRPDPWADGDSRTCSRSFQRSPTNQFAWALRR